MIKVAIIEDEVLFLDAFNYLIDKMQNIEVIMKATDGSDFLQQLQETQNIPDVIISDINMSPMNGFDCAEKLKEIHPNIPIIFLSSHYKDSYLGHMINYGISAFLPKNIHISSLEKALRNVFENQVYFSDKEYDLMKNFKEVKAYDPIPLQNLDSFELDFIQQITQRKTITEIKKSYYGPLSFEEMQKQLIHKLGLRNLAELIVYAVKNESQLSASV